VWSTFCFLAADKPFFSTVTNYPSSLVLADQSSCLKRVLSVSHMLMLSTVTKYPSSLVLADQSSCLKRVLSVSHMLMLSARSFFRKLRVFIRSHVSEATSPLHGAGGVVFGGYILWVSNGAPLRPLDASKGRPSLTSYNEIVSVPL
jgi:hypothetical protein